MEKNKIKEVLDSHLYIDILRKSSVKGIQKDDILIEISKNGISKLDPDKLEYLKKFKK